MNKKILLTSLFIVPLACSCHGVLITSADARAALENINSELSKNPNDYDKFVYYYDESNAENDYSKTKVIYDKGAKFYYSYKISYLHIEENWLYVKDNGEESYIFKGSRLDGAHDQNNSPLVEYEWDLYSDEKWNAIKDNIINILDGYLSFSLERMEKMINYYDYVDDNIVMTSFNKHSLCVEGNTSDRSFLYRVDDLFLKEFNYQIDDYRYKKFSCDYEKATITYLNIDVPSKSK